MRRYNQLVPLPIIKEEIPVDDLAAEITFWLSLASLHVHRG